MRKLLFYCSLIGWVETTRGQNVGIGVSNPTHARLEVSGSVGAAVAMFGSDKYGVTVEADNPEIGFNYFYNNGTKTIKAGYASYMGMFPASGDLYIGTFNGNQSATDFGAIAGPREAFRIKQNGNIGIGVDPVYPLTVKSNGAAAGIVQESPDGTAQVGFYTSFNAAYLQTWTNTNLDFATGNGVSRMVLNTNGSVTIKKSLNVGTGVLSITTGASNLLPLAFGNIAQDGTVIQSAGNIVVAHPSTGEYQLTITGEDMAANESKYTVMLTPRSFNDNVNVFARNWSSYFISNGVIYISTGSILVNAETPTSCGCGASYLNSGNPAQARDCGFDITIYKNN